MKDESSVPAAQKMTDASLLIFRVEVQKRRVQMIDDTRPIVLKSGHQGRPLTLTVSLRKTPAVMICSPEIFSEQSPKYAAQHARIFIPPSAIAATCRKFYHPRLPTNDTPPWLAFRGCSDSQLRLVAEPVPSL